MEVGEFIVHDFFVYLGLGCEEERLQRGEEIKIKKKANQVGPSTVQKSW